MAKGTIIYMGNFELPDKNAAAHRVVNNGKVFTALGYRTAFLGTVKNESVTIQNPHQNQRKSIGFVLLAN